MSLVNWLVLCPLAPPPAGVTIPPGEEFPKTAATSPGGFYREAHSEPSGEFSPDDASLTRVLYCRWDERLKLVQDALGYSLPGAPTFARTLPDAHPDAADFFCTNAAVKPVGQSKRTLGSDGVTRSQWNLARVELTYRPLNYPVLADTDVQYEWERFIEVRLDTKADYLQLGINSFKWVSRPTIPVPPNSPPGAQPAKQPLGATPGIIAPAQTLKLVWHQVPALADDPYYPPTSDRIPALLGHTNDSVLLDRFPAGTLLFVAAQAEPILDRFGGALPGGRRHWRVEYEFEVRNRGQFTTASTPAVTEYAGVNWLYDPANARWDLVTTTGDPDGGRIYTPKDLTRLFDLGAFTP